MESHSRNHLLIHSFHSFMRSFILFIQLTAFHSIHSFNSFNSFNSLSFTPPTPIPFPYPFFPSISLPVSNKQQSNRSTLPSFPIPAARSYYNSLPISPFPTNDRVPRPKTACESSPAAFPASLSRVPRLAPSSIHRSRRNASPIDESAGTFLCTAR